jgi:hypothetical protein
MIRYILDIEKNIIENMAPNSQKLPQEHEKLLKVLKEK